MHMRMHMHMHMGTHMGMHMSSDISEHIRNIRPTHVRMVASGVRCRRAKEYTDTSGFNSWAKPYGSHLGEYVKEHV